MEYQIVPMNDPTIARYPQDLGMKGNWENKGGNGKQEIQDVAKHREQRNIVPTSSASCTGRFMKMQYATWPNAMIMAPCFEGVCSKTQVW